MTHDEKSDPKKSDLSQQDIYHQIEQLQIDLEANPKSLSFAQLADLYIAENMIDAAEALLERSLKYHPHSVSGHLLYAKVLSGRSNFTDALTHLNFAIQKAPTNWSSYLLRAEVHLKLHQSKLALQDYKILLLHNPTHPLARRAVAKLEVLTADEYESDFFQMKSLRDLPQAQPKTVLDENQKNAVSLTKVPLRLDRVLSLIDAFTVRHEYEKALKLLRECRTEFGDHPEISDRLLRLSQFESAEKIRPKTEPHLSLSRTSMITEKKLKSLELLLRNIRQMKIRPLESD